MQRGVRELGDHHELQHVRDGVPGSDGERDGGVRGFAAGVWVRVYGRVSPCGRRGGVQRDVLAEQR